MGFFVPPAKPYNHEAASLEESCGITRNSWSRFCHAFDETVGAARKQKPAQRSREVEAFEMLMHRHPRELCYYITDLLADLAEQDYLRRILKRLLSEPREEAAKEDDLENINCAGSA